MSRRRRRKPRTREWARDFLKPTEYELETERLRDENVMLREKPAAANDLVVEARLRVTSGRRRPG